MSPAAAILLLTAFAAGITGAWSPCGFSMVETLGGARSHRGAATVRTSCATFALGALGGGAITFTALAALGVLLGGTGSGAALIAATAIALAAALGEALGVRVVPQIRRQVPEPWRRTLPLPLAAGLYGVLLGLGFTTFVLTLAVWALAGIAVAVGDLHAGLLIGLGFGAGRALPVVLMAPRYATLGRRLELAMAERPALLRRLRLADGALLAALAFAFLASGSATAARGPQPVASHATDPSVAGGALAFERVGGAGAVLSPPGGGRTELPARLVAIGGRWIATSDGTRVVVSDRVTGVRAIGALPDNAVVTQLAVSDRWLVWRTPRPGGGDRLYAGVVRPHPGPGRGLIAPIPPPRIVAGGAGARAAIDRPSLSGDRLAFAATTATGSRIVVVNLAAHRRRTLLSVRRALLSQPALDGGRLLLVRTTYCAQRLQLLARGRARTLLTLGTTAHRDAGHEPGYTSQGSEPSRCPPGTPPRTDTMLWTTALAGRSAYVTLLRPGAGRTPPRARIVRVGVQAAR
ncbi:MAG TPA: hypothetical protein VFU94_00640 [Conexibacter sp.]|nr:hypothetical protein [Conexibacter sp.]